MEGWIKLHRKILEWEWYDDANCFRVFMHLMLSANHKDNKWRGKTIKRGEHITSLNKLADNTGLSVSKVRTALNKLESTGEIASQSQAQNTVFTIKNYDSYQGDDTALAEQSQANDKPIASESQTVSKPIATNKNDKKEKNEQERKELIDSGKPPSKRFTPPTYQEVYEFMGEYAQSKNKIISEHEPEKFINFYSAKNWYVGKNKMKDWKSSARNWVMKAIEYQEQQPKQKGEHQAGWSQGLLNNEEIL